MRDMIQIGVMLFMVVVRVGAGPNQWNEQFLISSILDAIN